MTVERIFEDVDRDVASDEECEAILEQIQYTPAKYHNPLAQKVK